MQDPNLEFRLPSAGDGALKAEIIQWFVAVGDRVSAGQPICSVETDKSMVDLTSPFTGEIASLGAEVGEVIEVGAVLVTAAGEPADDPTSNEAFSPLVRRLAEEFGVELSSLAGTGPDGRVTRADVQRAAFGTEISAARAPASGKVG